MDKLNFLSDKTKQIMGYAFAAVFIAAFMAPLMPNAHPQVAAWSGWVSQLAGLVSVALGLQVFNPSKR